MMRSYVKEDFLDNSEDVLIDLETSSKEDYSDINSAEWYSLCYNSDKNFNVMFSVLFSSLGSYTRDIQKIKEIEKILTLLISRRSEMSSFHVSTTKPLKNPYFERYNMPSEDVYSGTVQWTYVQNPIFIKVAFNYNQKSVNNLMNIILRLMSYIDRNKEAQMQLQVYKRLQSSHYGWKVISENGMLLSMTVADDIAELVQTPDTDTDYLRKLYTNISMFFNDLLPNIKPFSYDDMLIWKASNAPQSLNEDFLDNQEREI